ncbi:MAG: hypothetical protein ACI3YA_05045 [Alloprevotella sp.]
MKKIYLLFLLTLASVGSMWAEGSKSIVCFGGNTAETGYGFITDVKTVSDVTSFSTTLTDGCAVSLTLPGGRMWAIDPTGTWTNTYAIDMMNAVLGSSFSAADFSQGSPLKFSSCGWQNTSTTLSFTMPSSYAAGDAIVFYLSLSSNQTTLNNFSVTGLNEAAISYASNNGSGFSSTATYSSGTGAITIVKVVGKVTSSPVVFASTTAKNGWQTISYCPWTADAEAAEAKIGAIASLNAKLAKGRLMGEGLGHYTYSGSENAAEIIATAEGQLTSETATTEQINASITALDGIYADFRLNMPEVGKLYRFKGKYSGNYISPTASTGMMGMQSVQSAPSTVFMLTEGNKLLSCNLGYYTTGTHTCDALKAAANTVTFAESTTYLGYYTLKSNAGGGAGQWFYDQSSNVNRNQGYEADRCDWTIEEITSMPVPVSNTYKIGTFVSPVPLSQDDASLKFYTGEIVGDYLVLTKHDGNIPANTPFLIEYQDGAAYENGAVYLDIAENADELGSEVRNALAGSIETLATPSGTIYTLQPVTENESTELMFCRYNGTTVKGGKAYLPSESAVKGIRFNTGESTGIESVATEKANKTIFDLSGRRVQNPTSGLYIINGEKVFVK